MSESANAPHFAIEKIYLKDVSFESPMAPRVFTMPFDSSLDLQVKVEPEQVGEHLWQVALCITATVRLGEQVAFLVEVEQAGLFVMANFEPEAVANLLNSYCPTLLFPYARETIANLSLKAGFPPLELQPLNFEALHAEQLANESA
jgi:preprotein translocase subunit SecB